ncbi:MAG: diaminopimelate epimerase [Calditrichaeota bacterium]|nr:diaminopimelate epimerase [Calditrichota bacterium]
MSIDFAKLSANGNDFVAMDNREGQVPLERPGLVAWLCDRRRGVGADGLLLVEHAQDADFRMRIFNPDGSEADMCGNGARACAEYAATLGIGGQELTFQTRAGLQRVRRQQGQSTLWIGSIVEDPGHLQRLEADARLVASIQPARLLGFLRVGVPHCVLAVNDLGTFPIERIGPAVRHHPSFDPEGSNVIFVQRLDSGHVRVRAWEKGVEGETEGCGTGCIAACVLLARAGVVQSPIDASMAGGVMRVGEDERGWHFSGEVHRAFEGRLDLPGSLG